MSIADPSYFSREVARVYAELPINADHFTQVRRAKKLMETHLHENIDLSEMAKTAGMSGAHFIRIFRQVYGMAPRKFLRDLRLSQAKSLLIQGLPVTEVCLAVGYESLPTFSNAFKRGMGQSPQAFQKHNKSNPE
ncbi:MAG: helix-turn-helix transcriptional regulator [Acidobacteria bacterium]|nr:helix-turn-helix transcriptional regulator [Acidobacteriota bacterium]MCB9399534.1 helix-turn-helix transcriptional regulator [Acidobacteriota bacterium]